MHMIYYLIQTPDVGGCEARADADFASHRTSRVLQTRPAFDSVNRSSPSASTQHTMASDPSRPKTEEDSATAILRPKKR